MYLSKLEILGFKSFANKTTIKFNKGITGIVGPNGCGKTNIVDAIRWCLGEQKSSTLRSDKMENVIFNGTKDKKPMGMSEVSLTLQNDRGQLPSDYTEINITRRIFRSGESEYYLNKNVCRLKDITNLFMDTGMGTNAYSVIELKMIEIILSSKADERRRLFEEAAGVNKYKLRKRVTLSKLDEVAKDLIRVNDIVSEVEKNVRALERQAKKFEKYKNLKDELKEKEILLAGQELYFCVEEAKQLQGEKQNNIENSLELSTLLNNLNSDYEKLKVHSSETSDVLRKKQDEIGKLNSDIHYLSKEVSVSEERIKSLENNKIRFNEELKEFIFQKESAEESLEEIKDEIELLESKHLKIVNEIEGIAEVIEIKRNEVSEFRELVKEKNKEVNILFKEVTSFESNLKNKQIAKEQTIQSVENLEISVNKLTNRIAKAVGYLSELEKEKDDSVSNLKQLEKLKEENEQKREKLKANISSLKEKELNKRGDINSLRNKVDFLQSIISNLEGISKGSKKLLTYDNWNKNKKLVSEIGNTKEEFRLAIEASLKNVLNNIILHSKQDLISGIKILTENKSGKASFVMQSNRESKKNLLGFINEISERQILKKLENEEGFIGWAAKFIQAEEKWMPIFEQILNKTIIVENFDQALYLKEKYPNFNYCTLNGDYLTSSGVIEAGSEISLDETLFGRKKQLDELKDKIPLLDNELNEILNEIENSENELNNIDLKEIDEQLKLLNLDIISIDKQIAQYEYEINKDKEEIEKAQNEINTSVANLNKFKDELSFNENQLILLKSNISTKENELSEYEKNLEIKEKDYRELSLQHNSQKVEAEKIRGNKQNKVNELRRIENSILLLTKNIEKRKYDLSTSLEQEETIKFNIEEANLKLDDKKAEKEVYLRDANIVEEKLKELNEKLFKTEEEINDIKDKLALLKEFGYKIELKENNLLHKVDNIKSKIKENYSEELSLSEIQLNENIIIEEEKLSIDKLKENLKSIGEVNVWSKEEYEVEKERLDFLLKQRNDLTESEKDLVKTIKEINTTAQNLFLHTFEQVRNHFKDIFHTLFDPGDEADLILENEEDPLESKIEIIAKPKGKRPTSIELLSGGEKTLTATALLFAIYLVKPSPFCILDEVDAPLDDANIDRFTRLLREFSDNTQFIIVTHNKRTMEATETMYGVTMQEEGVSKIAAVQFTEDLPVD